MESVKAQNVLLTDVQKPVLHSCHLSECTKCCFHWFSRFITSHLTQDRQFCRY